MLQEKHSIFGGADRLRACIEDVVNTYRPKCLIIANSCVAGVIGDDVEAVGKESEVKYGIPVFTVPCYGFLDGEYYQGYFAVAEQLAERFFHKRQNWRILRCLLVTMEALGTLCQRG